MTRLRVAYGVAAIVPRLILAQQSTASPSVAVTGYLTSSYTWSTRSAADTIVGRAYDRRHNEFMLNVANITLDHAVPTDRVSAGFHFEAWFGQDAAVVKAVGLDLGPNADVWQSFVTLNVPLAGASRSLQLKAGKLATLMGVEVGEDISNPNLGIGYQDIFLEPFTETGVELDGKFGSRFDAELRMSNGWDQVNDVNRGKTVMARIGLAPDDRTLFAVVGYAGPEQRDNTSNLRAGGDALLSRKLTRSVVAQVQVDYGHESGASSGGSSATWFAAGCWTTIDLASAAAVALRADYMEDRNGARTSGVLGFPPSTGLGVGSVTATLNFKRWEHALVRPEARFDHASRRIFADGTSQFSVGMGLSYIF